MSGGQGHSAWSSWIAINKDSLPRFPPTEEEKPGKINFEAAHDMFLQDYKAMNGKDYKPKRPYVKGHRSIYQDAVYKCRAHCKACLAEAEQLKVKRKKKGAKPPKEV